MEELVKEAKNGNKEAFTKLVILYKEDLFKLAITKARNEQDAEDLVQETMEEAYLSIRKLRSDEAFKKWIVKILLNKCKNYYRGKGGRVINLDNIILQNIRHSGEDYIERTESAIDFNLLIDDLSEIEKTIIILYYYEKYSIKETGKILNINENTIKSKLKRVKEKIKIRKKEEVKNG